VALPRLSNVEIRGEPEPVVKAVGNLAGSRGCLGAAPRASASSATATSTTAAATTAHGAAPASAATATTAHGAATAATATATTAHTTAPASAAATPAPHATGEFNGRAACGGGGALSRAHGHAELNPALDGIFEVHHSARVTSDEGAALTRQIH
jgi:hypothetical protein